ncbi:hypothetical protein HYW53_01465 [Candidatus Giovannonibacteria bacterium]|nr:hypothetical protein [Candidatus Giovannonibacteria bacterium]
MPEDHAEEKSPPSAFLTLSAWEAPEFEYHEKRSDWYWAVGIVTIAFFAVAIILQNFLFAILILLAGLSFSMYGAKRPRVISFAITSRGLKIGKVLYPFDNLKSFWLNYDPPHVKELYIISKKVFMPQISIPLGNANPNQIREHLLKFLEEKEIHEPLSETIARFFRF